LLILLIVLIITRIFRFINTCKYEGSKHPFLLY